MKKSLLLFFISFIYVVFFFSCNKDTSPTGPDKFNLFLINNTSQNFSIYISANMDEDGFVNKGELGAKETRSLEDLIINITYTIRLTYQNKTPDEEGYIYHEFTFINDSASTTTITKEIN